MGHTRDQITGSAERIAGLYTGRDPGGTYVGGGEPPMKGVPLGDWISETRTRGYGVAETGVNLFLSRHQQVFIASDPGRPNWTILSLNAQAMKQAEDQEKLSDAIANGSGLDAAVSRSAFLAPLQTHVGTKLVKNPRSRGDHDKVSWEVIEADYCGTEPFSARFTWHSRIEQWGAIPAAWKKELKLPPGEAPKPWEACGVVEVYDTGFALEDGDAERKDCRVHVFLQPKGKFYKTTASRRAEVGDYCITHDLPCSPLFVDSNLEPAPNEAVAPAEAAAWVPILNMIANTVNQIDRQVRNTDRFILYDQNAVDKATLTKMLQSAATSAESWLPVTVNEQALARGISHTARPLERDSVLGELIEALSTHMALLDDVTGVGPQDRGMSINPSKTATESGVLSAAASRRHAARLRKLARRWEAMLRIVFYFQREFYGEYMKIPGDGVLNTIRVPDAAEASFSFVVSLDEMENLSRRGRLESAMMVHTVLTNHSRTFPNGEPRVVRESLRQLLQKAGWKEADLFFDIPVVDVDPKDRYITALRSGKSIVVREDDNHESYLAYYGAKSAELAGGAQDDAGALGLLQEAIAKHQVYLRQRASAGIGSRGGGNTSTVPGVSAQGDVDNQISAAVNAGQPPQLNPQQLGYT